MSIIKKVLANVAQTLTRAEQTIAKKNIGLGDTAYQPPQDPYFIPAGGLVWDPGHNSVYRLLEDWSYTRSWDSVTKKVRVMPNTESDPLRIDIDINELNTNKPGTTALVNAILTFGKPHIRLHLNDYNVVIFEYAEFHRAGGGTSSHVFRTWQPDSGDSPANLSFEQITVTSRDNINYSGFSVSIKGV